jgi:hypothetical protein
MWNYWSQYPLLTINSGLRSCECRFNSGGNQEGYEKTLEDTVKNQNAVVQFTVCL